MRATPLMLAIALGLGLPAGSPEAASPKPADALRADALQRYIVVFDEAPAASFRGFDKADRGRPALAATSPQATGARKYDARSLEAVAYVDFLHDVRRVVLNDAAVAVMRPLEPVHVYTHALNGVSLDLTAGEAKRLAAVPGVRTVRPEFTRTLQLDRGPAWIKADQVWSGAATGTPNTGAGALVGVIDSGIRQDHAAFAGTGFPSFGGPFLGYCATNPSFCNNKLVGLWDYTAGTGGNTSLPSDTDGHGTHTASTAAGNAFVSGGVTYSGVAPGARLIAYKACPGNSCNGAALLASIDRAVADGVDVINYSIGSGPFDPWDAVGVPGADDAEAFLNAREAGVVVAAAAGNNGPEPGTHSNPANSPWVMGVAAATHDRGGAGDRLASFSGRGPVVPLGVVKPDITAPGVSIRAAGITGVNSMNQLSGTSMATPHVAGAAALLSSINPSHSPDEIISALMLTARPSVTEFSLPTTPHEQGAGMVDVALAARAGLYLDVPAGAFAIPRANPYTGNAQNLNLPSLGHGACYRTCTLTRAFKQMPGAPVGNYTVQASFTDAPGASITPTVTSFTSSAAGQSISFNINVDNTALVGKWIYGTVTLVNTSGDGRPNLRLPVAVYASPFSSAAAESALSLIQRNVTAERGFFDLNLNGLVPLPNARFSASSLVAPVVTVQNIPADPTNSNPYDAGSNTYIRLVQVPATVSGQAPVQYRLSVTTQAANNDIDLFVGRDANNDGQGSASEELCESVSTGSNESCFLNITSEASPRQYWIVVQNYAGPGTNVRVESILLPVSASPDSAMVASGPGQVAANANFRVRVAYDDPSLLNGESRQGILFIQASPDSTPIEVPVRLSRSGSTFEPFALANNVGRAVTLPAGLGHDKLYFDVPPHATSVEFSTTGATGNIDLYVAHVASPTGPTINPAPAWNGQAAFRAATGSGNETLVLSGGNLQPGRYYVVPVNSTGAAASATVRARITAQGTRPAFLSGQYANLARSGHGMFVDFGGPIGNPDQWITVWYAYLEDTTPTWYFSQGTPPGAEGIWRAELFRVVWNGSSTHAVDVGDVIITPTGPETMTMNFNLDGRSGFEPMVRVGGGSCPQFNGSNFDASGHWFSPAASGFGYSYLATGGANPQEVFIPYVYDGQGFPRWLYGQKDFNSAVNNFSLQWFSGFSPLAASVGLTGNAAGTGTRTLATNNVTNMSVSTTFGGALSGTWAQNLPVALLSQRKNCQ